MQRHASSEWSGDLKSGTGSVKVGSGAFALPYSFISRFESSGDTNPEELLGAAHAGCFSMALAHALSTAGHKVERIATTATVSMDKDAPPSGKGFSITGIALRTRGRVAGLSAPEFQRFAEDTKANCIVSRALAAVPMTLDAALD